MYQEANLGIPAGDAGIGERYVEDGHRPRCRLRNEPVLEQLGAADLFPQRVRACAAVHLPVDCTMVGLRRAHEALELG